MSPRDSLINFYRQSYPAHPSGYAFNFADAILGLAEIEKLINFKEATYLKHAEHRHKCKEDCPTWHDGCNCIIPYDEFDNEDFKKVVEMKGKADKWDNWNPTIRDEEYAKTKQQINLMLKNKVVKEKCKDTKHYGSGVVWQEYHSCPTCHGTGHDIERPPTPEEAEEFMENILLFGLRTSRLIFIQEKGQTWWQFNLKSGHIMMTRRENGNIGSHRPSPEMPSS